MRLASWLLLLVAGAPAAAAGEATPVAAVTVFWSDVTAAGGVCDEAFFRRVFTAEAADAFSRQIADRGPGFRPHLLFQLPVDAVERKPVTITRIGPTAIVDLVPEGGPSSETYRFDLVQVEDGWRIASVSSVFRGSLRESLLTEEGAP